MPATDWQPTIGDEVKHISTGRVGRMTLRNNAVHDEIAVRWAGPLRPGSASATWCPPAPDRQADMQAAACRATSSHSANAGRPYSALNRPES